MGAKAWPHAETGLRVQRRAPRRTPTRKIGQRLSVVHLALVRF